MTSYGKSIAVLPFVNMSNDPEQEYFSDGITEEILNSLAHINDLQVAGRTSTFYFKGKNMDLRSIGQQLNVATILEGSVRKQGEKIRITVQLINVEDGYHIWSEKYDRQIIDIFKIQDEIAVSITEKLRVTLLANEKVTKEKAPTNNHEAYDLFLKGRYYFNKRGASISKGMQFFKQALETDPGLALAYTGLADAYCILSLYCMIPPNEAMPKARHFAEKALELNNNSAETFTALAFINTFYDWNWTEAKNRFQHTVATYPNYAPARYWYSYYLTLVEKKHEESIRHAEITTTALEPFVHISHHILSFVYFNAGQFENGVRSSRKAIELDAHSYPGYRGLALNLAGLEQHSDAITAMKKAIELSGRQALPITELCWIYSKTGQKDDQLKLKEELTLRAKTEYISAMLLGCVSNYVQEHDEAISYFELAFEQRDCSLVFIKAYAPGDFVNTDERYHRFLKRMNFPE